MPIRPAAALALLPASAALLALGAVLGGWWLRGALVWLTAAIWLGDALLPRQPRGGAEGGADGAPRLRGAPAAAGGRIGARAAPVLAALLHLALLALSVAGMAGLTGLAAGERAALLVAAALFAGQIGVAAGHELIHRPGRAERGLGMVVFASILFGHHATAHGAVHHVHVATSRDPNTARRGESLWAFLPRAWAGSWRAGFAVARSRLAAAGQPPWRHPYLAQGAVSLGWLCAAWAGAGWPGLAALLAVGLAAQAQLLITDYVQHYGLCRARLPDGRPEPVGPAHSWNARARMSGAVLLAGPFHSAHHTDPGRGWEALDVPARTPLLPASLPVMAAAALFPPLWRAIMHPRLDRLARKGAASAQGDRAARAG